MSRTPDGTDPQPRTDTALFAHLAYKLEGVRTTELNVWARRLGIEVGADALRNAPRHAARLAHAAGGHQAARSWLLPDWRALDFFQAVVRIELSGARSAQIDRLVAIPGVVDLFVCEDEAIALVVYERRREREDLRSRLEDFGRLASWQEVKEHRPEAMISTFRDSAREAAHREQLIRR